MIIETKYSIGNINANIGCDGKIRINYEVWGDTIKEESHFSPPKKNYLKVCSMRAIKFRGKRYGDGTWVYGSLYQGTKEGEDYSIILNDAGYHLAPQDDRNLAIAFAEEEVNVVIPNTVGQFTGLRDYDGKEIFEGDIVKCCYMIPEWGWSGGAEEKVIGAVEYCRGDFCIGEYPIVSFQGDEMEVIGNIYDNYELLKNL